MSRISLLCSLLALSLTLSNAYAAKPRSAHVPAKASNQRAVSINPIQELKKKAERGDGDAQFMLGLLYTLDTNFSPYDSVYWLYDLNKVTFAKSPITLRPMDPVADYLSEDEDEAEEEALIYSKMMESIESKVKAAKARRNQPVVHNSYKNEFPKDDHMAFYWFHKAAERGYLGAQNNLALMYAFGKGVPQDYQSAFEWTKKAAEQNLAQAQCNLGFIYFKGQGVDQDFYKAYLWLNLGAAREPRCIKIRDSVLSKLTKEDVQSAQEWTRNWKPTQEGQPE